jgi:hypothetical protein
MLTDAERLRLMRAFWRGAENAQTTQRARQRRKQLRRNQQMATKTPLHPSVLGNQGSIEVPNTGAVGPQGGDKTLSTQIPAPKK